MSAVRLDRSSSPRAPRPVRIVHIGIGNFSRSHQAWYTQTADSQRQWGIAGFTGRRADVADALGPQQGLYALIERRPNGDCLSVVDAVQDVRPGADVRGLIEAVAAPQTAVVTLTITEAGYRPPAAAERAAAGAGDTALGRLSRALVERHRRGAGPLALVSCDNLHANGQVLRERIVQLIGDDRAVEWVQRELAFVATSVDRITPAATDADRALVESAIGLHDAAPVVCEPFSDWVLCGEFPAGRPEWEQAGARFVGELEPWELRKLWLLNGGHSLLAYLGLLRGHRTVAEAVDDRELGTALDRYWDLATRYLPAGGVDLDLRAYRAQLRERFANARIGYPLTQIAADGLDKLRHRVVPVIEAARAAGDSAEPATRIASAWARWLIGDPQRALADQNAQQLLGVLRSFSGEDAERGLVDLLGRKSSTISEESS
jgi:fructuronate reductase